MKVLFIFLSFALAVFLWVCCVFYTKGDASVVVGIAALVVSLSSIFCGEGIVRE